MDGFQFNSIMVFFIKNNLLNFLKRLVFKNNDPFGKPIIVIFKYGDDLRQDILTLQVKYSIFFLKKKIFR